MKFEDMVADIVAHDGMVYFYPDRVAANWGIRELRYGCSTSRLLERHDGDHVAALAYLHAAMQDDLKDAWQRYGSEATP